MELQKKFYPELVQKFPFEVRKIFEIFDNDTIRLVGGCVRDLLLKKEVNDFDFATKFLPQKIIKILGKNNIQAVPTGIKFGTVTAVLDGKNFEITSLRKDLATDGRHCKPEFIDDYFFDAKRRDFTINSLYLDSSGFVYDYFSGIEDLKNQKVKFIGNAKQRIEEDFLRILRFFRFSCNYAKELDSEGLRASIEQKEKLKFLSADRIRNEVFKILSTGRKPSLLSCLKLLEDSQIRSEIFSAEFKIHNLQNLFEACKVLQIKPSSHLQFFVLVCDEKLNLEEIFHRLNFSNVEKKYFKSLLKSFLLNPKALEYEAIKELLAFEKKPLVQDFYLLNLAQNFPLIKISKIQKDCQFIERSSLPKFPLNGEIIARLGFNKEEIGKALVAAKKFWAKNDFKTDKTTLINFLNHKFEN